MDLTKEQKRFFIFVVLFMIGITIFGMLFGGDRTHCISAKPKKAWLQNEVELKKRFKNCREFEDYLEGNDY